MVDFPSKHSHLVVSWNGGNPQIIPFSGIFHYELSNLGYLHLWKPHPHLVRGFSASMFDDTSPIFGHPTAAAEVAPQALLERAGAAPAANSLIRPEKDGKIPQLCSRMFAVNYSWVYFSIDR